MKFDWPRVLFILACIGVATWFIWLLLAVTKYTGFAEASGIRSAATCYDLQGTTASGTYVNARTAAHNFIPFRTKIRIIGKQAGPLGVRKYIIRDTGPALSDGHFDLWSYKGVCANFGHRTIRFKYGWGKPLRRGIHE